MGKAYTDVTLRGFRLLAWQLDKSQILNALFSILTVPIQSFTQNVAETSQNTPLSNNEAHTYAPDISYKPMNFQNFFPSYQGHYKTLEQPSRITHHDDVRPIKSSVFPDNQDEFARFSLGELPNYEYQFLHAIPQHYDQYYGLTGHQNIPQTYYYKNDVKIPVRPFHGSDSQDITQSNFQEQFFNNVNLLPSSVYSNNLFEFPKYSQQKYSKQNVVTLQDLSKDLSFGTPYQTQANFNAYGGTSDGSPERMFKVNPQLRRALIEVDTDNLSPEMLYQLKEHLKLTPANYIKNVVKDSFDQSSASFNDFMQKSFRMPIQEMSNVFHKGSYAFDRDSEVMKNIFNTPFLFPTFPKIPLFGVDSTDDSTDIVRTDLE